MPYIREGKCVYKKNPNGSKGASKGCSDSVEKAKKHMAALYAAENKAMAEFSMAITKASIPDKVNRTMRLSMVNSDTGEDAYEERMSVDLFNDFVERIEKNISVPEPFIDALNDGNWKGGMPYLSISHYKSANGENVPGVPEKVYVDGQKLKSTAVLHDNPLGLAVWKSVCQDIEERDKPIEERTFENPVRISIGFLDLEHKHEIDGEEDFVFTRTDIKNKCPKCEDGINGKVYLKGQLVHLAFTRVPANPRTQVEVYRMGDEIKTKRDDAKSIIGNLAEGLVGKSTAKDDVLVTKASEKDLEEYVYSVRDAFYSKFPPPDPQPYTWVRSVTDKSVIVSEDGHLYKVGYKEDNGDFSFDERSKWQAVQIGYVAMKSEAETDEWEVELEQESSEEEQTPQKSEVIMADQVETPAEVVEESVVEKPAAAAPEKSKVDTITEKYLATLAEVKQKGLHGEAAKQILQPVLNELAKVTQDEIADPMQGIADVVRSAVAEAVAGLKPELVAEVLKAIPTSGVMNKTSAETPQPRSLQLFKERANPETKEMSQIEKLAYQSTVGVAGQPQ